MVGLGQVTDSFFTKNMPCYLADSSKYLQWRAGRRSEDHEGERHTLNSSGKFVDKGGQAVTVTVVSGNLFNSGPEYAITQYEKAGFSIDPKVTDFATASAAQKSGAWDVYFGSNPVIQPIPSNGMLYITGGTPAVPNFGKTNAPQVEAATTAALGTSGAGECAAWEKVQKLALQQAIAEPLPPPAVVWYTKNVKVDPEIAFVEIWSLRDTSNG